MLVPLILSTTVCVLLAGRSLSLPRLSASVLISQVLFHTLFVLGTPVSGSTKPSGHGMPGMETVAVTVDPTTPMAMGSADGWMWLAHAIAAVTTIAALYRGERCIAQLVTRAAMVIARLLPSPRRLTPAPVVIRWQSTTFAEQPVRLPLGVFLSARSHRGPPTTPFA